MKKKQIYIDAAKEKREALKKLSNEVLKLDRELYPDDEENRAGINFLLMHYVYNKGNNLTFHTFQGWLREGYTVKKGEKAFLLWGQPREGKRPQPKEGQDEEFSFFPLAYVFSNEQVSKAEGSKAEQVQAPPEPEYTPTVSPEFIDIPF